jgi:trans-aconitate methyltransferase
MFFVPIPQAVLPDIQKALAVSKGSIVYDLRCGDGRVLFHLARRCPEATYIGIENSTFPFILAKIRLWYYKKKTGKDNVRIVKSDFLNQSLSQATHVFVYLYPNIMDNLLPKFDKELTSGVRLVSASFRFTQKKARAEVDLERTPFKIVRKLFIYEF